MKKLVVFLTMMMGTLTISGTTLTAGSQSFTLSNLSKMYFARERQMSLPMPSSMISRVRTNDSLE